MGSKEDFDKLLNSIKEQSTLVDKAKLGLEFYKNQKNKLSPSKGFALQYDPQPSLRSVDDGQIAIHILEAIINQNQV